MSLLSNLMGVSNGPSGSMLGGLSNLQNNMNVIQKFQQFAANPVAGLMSMNPRLQIPQNLINNPEAVVKHLISTGQMTQEQYQQLSQTANQLKNMLPR